MVALQIPKPEGVDEYAVNPDDAARLWKLSAELTGIDAFSSVHTNK